MTERDPRNVPIGSAPGGAPERAPRSGTGAGLATELLARLAGGEGDRSAIIEQFFPLVYDELRSLAAGYLHRERRDHTLQPTALVNEAYLRLIDQRVGFASRGHFLAIAATAMRRVLVNHARDRGRLKRGGAARRETLESGHTIVDEPDLDLAALDEAMERLAALDPRKVQVVEMRFFAGLSEEDVAAALGVSTRTVKRDWQIARAWLRRELA
jgi:RNA polymerase sigma factor (TIGR02999 family)